MQELKYTCCFCNKSIELTGTDPCGLNIFPNANEYQEDRESQAFFCHLNCFKAKLHPKLGFDSIAKDSNHACCFCNSSIATDSIDPCELDILISFDNPLAAGTFFCHFNCFKEKLHEKIKKWLALDIIRQ